MNIEGLAFLTVSFAQIGLASIEDSFAEVSVLSPVAALADHLGGVVVGVVPGVRTCVVVDFAKLEAATISPVVSEGPSCLTVFP